jgi:hypothetical protein
MYAVYYKFARWFTEQNIVSITRHKGEMIRIVDWFWNTFFLYITIVFLMLSKKQTIFSDKTC